MLFQNESPPNKPKHFVQSFTFNVDVRMMLLYLQLLA